MSKKDEPRELNPISWMSDDPDLEENIYDFRAIPEVVTDDEDEAEADDPKASSAPKSAGSSETEQQQDEETPAPVERDNTQLPDPAASTPTSSDPKTSGSSEPHASGKTQSSSSPSGATPKPVTKPS